VQKSSGSNLPQGKGAFPREEKKAQDGRTKLRVGKFNVEKRSLFIDKRT
jgi:hypothetical protein